MLQQRSKLPVAEFWDALQQEDWEFFTSCSYPTSFWREEVKLPPTRGTEIYVYEVDSLLSGPCLKRQREDVGDADGNEHENNEDMSGDEKDNNQTDEDAEDNRPITTELTYEEMSFTIAQVASLMTKPGAWAEPTNFLLAMELDSEYKFASWLLLAGDPYADNPGESMYSSHEWLDGRRFAVARLHTRVANLSVADGLDYEILALSYQLKALE